MSASTILLKNHKLRKTDFRLKVLEVFLQRSHAAVSNQELEQQLGEFDRITLYRTLKKFESSGLVHQVMDGSATTKYALCANDCKVHQLNKDHAHFHCNTCGETYCMDNIGSLDLTLPKNYTLDKVQLALSGVCGNCH